MYFGSFGKEVRRSASDGLKSEWRFVFEVLIGGALRECIGETYMCKDPTMPARAPKKSVALAHEGSRSRGPGKGSQSIDPGG